MVQVTKPTLPWGDPASVDDSQPSWAQSQAPSPASDGQATDVAQPSWAQSQAPSPANDSFDDESTDDGDAYLTPPHPSGGWEGILQGDPCPEGEDGWPQPTVSAGPSSEEPILDTLFEPGAAPAPRKRQTFTTPTSASSPSLEAILPTAAGLVVTGASWAFLAPEMHQLPGWLIPLASGVGTWWVWSSTDRMRGLIAAGLLLGVSALYWLWAPLAIMVAVAAIVVAVARG